MNSFKTINFVKIRANETIFVILRLIIKCEKVVKVNQ